MPYSVVLLVALAAAPPMTLGDANQVLAKADEALIAVQVQPKGAYKPVTTVSREVLVGALHDRFQRVKAKAAFTPLPGAIDRRTTLSGLSREGVAKLKELLRWRMVDPASVLVTSNAIPGRTEWLEATAYFLARSADITHTPDPKFSPYLAPIEAD